MRLLQIIRSIFNCIAYNERPEEVTEMERSIKQRLFLQPLMSKQLVTYKLPKWFGEGKRLSKTKWMYYLHQFYHKACSGYNQTAPTSGKVCLAVLIQMPCTSPSVLVLPEMLRKVEASGYFSSFNRNR